MSTLQALFSRSTSLSGELESDLGIFRPTLALSHPCSPWHCPEQKAVPFQSSDWSGSCQEVVSWSLSSTQLSRGAPRLSSAFARMKTQQREPCALIDSDLASILSCSLHLDAGLSNTQRFPPTPLYLPTQTCPARVCLRGAPWGKLEILEWEICYCLDWMTKSTFTKDHA